MSDAAGRPPTYYLIQSDVSFPNLAVLSIADESLDSAVSCFLSDDVNAPELQIRSDRRTIADFNFVLPINILAVRSVAYSAFQRSFSGTRTVRGVIQGGNETVVLLKVPTMHVSGAAVSPLIAFAPRLSYRELEGAELVNIPNLGLICSERIRKLLAGAQGIVFYPIIDGSEPLADELQVDI